MMDGSVLSGDLEEHEINREPPDWIKPPHQRLDAYSIYLRVSIRHHFTSFLRERRLPDNPTKPHIPFHIYIQSRRGKQATALNIRFVDNEHQIDLSKEQVYLAMPDGSVFVGDFP